MKAKDLRTQVFGDFENWLVKQKVVVKEFLGEQNPFSMDVWMNKVFDVLYAQYEREKQKEQIRANNLLLFSSEELRDMANLKFQAEQRKKGEAAQPAPGTVRQVRPGVEVEEKDGVAIERPTEKESEKEAEEDVPDNVKKFPGPNSEN